MKKGEKNSGLLTVQSSCQNSHRLACFEVLQKVKLSGGGGHTYFCPKCACMHFFYSSITKIEKRGLTLAFALRLMQGLKLLVVPVGVLSGRRQLLVTVQKSRLGLALCRKE